MSNCACVLRLVLLVALCRTLTACGGDECKRGSTECVSDKLIRTCVPSEGENQWLVSQCSPTEHCLTVPSLAITEGYTDDEDDAGVSKPRTPPGLVPQQPACVGDCEVG